MNSFMIVHEKTRLRVAELNLITYRILEEGGTGVIYLASGVLKGTSSEGTYAVKVIETDKAKTLKREIEVSNMLKESPVKGTVQVFHAELIDEKHGLVIMECMDSDLGKYLEMKRFISEYEAKKIIAQLLDAICALNNRGYMDRDVKFGNILVKKVGDECIAKLGDFGEVREFKKKQEMESNYTIIGTSGFASPEAFSGKYDEKTDMWSLGVVAYRMLYGQMPFNCESSIEYKKCLDSYALGAEKAKLFDQKVSISQACREFLERLLDTDSRTRWSCEEAAASTFIAQSITLWYVESKPARRFKRLVLMYKDISLGKDPKDFTWGDLVTVAESKIGDGRKRENALIITNDGNCVDPEQKVDETGRFDNLIEAFIVFDGDDVKENMFLFTDIEKEEEERCDSINKCMDELRKTVESFRDNMNLGRINLFLEKLSQYSSIEFDPLFSIASMCQDSEIALKMVCMAFSRAISDDLNPALAKFTNNVSHFKSIGNIRVRTFLPFRGNKISLDDFMHDYAADEIIRKGKEVIQKISVLKTNVMKLSQMEAQAFMAKKQGKKIEEETCGEVISGESISKEAHECARDLEDLSERMKGSVVMALEWRFRETWNLFISGSMTLRTLGRMSDDMMKAGDLNSKTLITDEYKKYENKMSMILRELVGCVAVPYMPNEEDEIKYLEKDCETLKNENEKLKKELTL